MGCESPYSNIHTLNIEVAFFFLILSHRFILSWLRRQGAIRRSGNNVQRSNARVACHNKIRTPMTETPHKDGLFVHVCFFVALFAFKSLQYLRASVSL